MLTLLALGALALWSGSEAVLPGYLAGMVGCWKSLFANSLDQGRPLPSQENLVTSRSE
jgi:hypothetical protein